jgi:D-2-hydroxyacid dehydrogenase (NADP+)
MLILFDLYHKDFEIWRYPLNHFENLKSEFPRVDFKYIKFRNEYVEHLPGADAVIGWRLMEEDFPLAGKLRWYHTMAAGVGSIFYEKFIESGIILTNSAGVRAAPMADCIMAYIIMLARRFPMLMKSQQKKFWARYDYWREIEKVIDLDKSVIGIIGYGGIGKEVGKRAKAAGMKVLAVKRSITTGIEYADEVFPPEKISEVLSRSDFIVLTLPHTKETDNYIGNKELDSVKTGAFIINAGRGKLIDHTALVSALKSNRIAGAALDVTDPEPLLENSPLWSMDNVIITPHISGIGPHFWERSQDLLRYNIRAFINGESLRNVVDKIQQY